MFQSDLLDLKVLGLKLLDKSNVFAVSGKMKFRKLPEQSFEYTLFNKFSAIRIPKDTFSSRNTFNWRAVPSGKLLATIK